MSYHEARRERVYEYLDRTGVDVFLVEDTEERRSPSLRYLSGHPNDALLFLCRSGKSVLMPWDLPLAKVHADADEILPYNDFGRRPLPALTGFLERAGYSRSSPSFKTALDKRFPFPAVTRIAERVTSEFPGAEIICADEGPDAFIEEMRIVKDAEEIRRIRAAAAILNGLIDRIEEGLMDGSLRSETDAALYIERECRLLGAEGTSFDTIAAGPKRSFGIHAFPNYGAGGFAEPGLSILDFGVRFEGYAGDVTLTLVTGGPSPRQKLMVDLVREAYAIALELCRPGESVSGIARAVDDFFGRHGFKMPHSLGHGLGVEVHEAPYLRAGAEDGQILRPGMVFTLEPGLYDPSAGGVRLENDILITETGNEVLTTSRILYKE